MVTPYEFRIQGLTRQQFAFLKLTYRLTLIWQVSSNCKQFCLSMKNYRSINFPRLVNFNGWTILCPISFILYVIQLIERFNGLFSTRRRLKMAFKHFPGAFFWFPAWPWSAWPQATILRLQVPKSFRLKLHSPCNKIKVYNLKLWGIVKNTS